MIYLIRAEFKPMIEICLKDNRDASWLSLDVHDRIKTIAINVLSTPHLTFTPLSPQKPSIGLIHDSMAYWKGMLKNEQAAALMEHSSYAEPPEILGDALLVAIDYNGDYDEFTKNPFSTETHGGVEGWPTLSR